MRPLFGWSYSRIASFDPYELGLTQKHGNDFTVEVGQRYFLLFRFPFFGLGTRWSICKNDSRYELPPDYKEVLSKRGDLQVSTPWYTYTWLLLATVAGLCFVVNTKYVYWERHRDFRKEYINDVAATLGRFREPVLYDYYTLAAGDGSEIYGYVSALGRERFQLSYINDPGVRIDKPEQLAGLFGGYSGTLHTISFGRGDSLQLICREYEKRRSFKGVSLNNDDGKSYRLQSIVRLDGPLFKDGDNATGYENGRYSFSVQITNEGLPATITRITPVEGNIEWTAGSLPLRLQADGRIALRGKGDYNKAYKLMLTCTDIQGRRLQYLMEGRNLHHTFRKIEL